MHKFFKRFLASALLACFPLVFSACGGGGSPDMTTISGTAVKGPIKGAFVRVFKMRSDGASGELLGSGVTGTDGSYALQIEKDKAVAPLLVTVGGQPGASYASEATGNDVPFTAAESFSAVLDSFDPAKKYTVSPLTEAAYQILQKFITDNPSASVDTRIAGAVNARVAALFNVRDILADPASDPAYSASCKIIDQMVVNSGTGSTIQTMNLINQAFVDVESPAYQAYRTALVAAASAVTAREPSIAAAVNMVLAAAANPPAQPVLTDTTAPDAVTNLTAVPGAETATTSSVTLSWKASSTTGKNPVTGYDVYRNGIKIASVATAGYVDAPLTPTTTYRYFVVAFDAAGNRSAASAEVTVLTPVAPNLNVTAGGQLSAGILALPQHDIIAPAAPAALSASTSALDAQSGSVRLTWSAATDNVAVTGYDVYRNGIKIGTVSQALFTDTPVVSNISYVYFVRAFDAAGNRSAESGHVTVIPPPASLGVTAGGQVILP